MAKPLVLVTGQNGQLGNELKLLAGEYNQFDYIFTDVMELDIADAIKVTHFFTEHKPSFCINAAAYTAVDKAETEKEITLKINADAVGNLAENCARLNARLVHVSTDYVFDGTANSPYTEDHPVSPVNFYGESKLRGEEIAIAKLPSSVIIRTSWVYSYFGNNFVKTMLRLMKDRESINVINDQFGSPTYARDLGEAILKMISRENVAPGIYHFSNEGVISWFDFAVAIRDLSGMKCDVKPIDTSGYPTPAKRPAYSVMSKEKIKALGIELKYWKDSLEQCIRLLQDIDAGSK
jgi:dTDP-4-dehydrorhamnose reductase